jgi:ATP-binding cassette subfamily B protein
VIDRLRARNEWQFAGVLPRADRGLAVAWWALVLLRGVLPALLAIAMGGLVGAVQRHAGLAAPLGLAGAVFVLLQVLPPIHRAVGANLGDRVAAWLYDRLTDACIRPPGMGHLENPRLTNDLTMARDFDLGISGPPMSYSMDFIAAGLVEMAGGLAAAVVLAGFAPWAPLLLAGAWLATHWLLRESGVWRDRNTEEVREAQRHADYAYRLAVEPPAAKELRLFGLGGWIVDGFRSRRRRLLDLQWQATRLRERPVVWSLLLVVAANLVVFWSLGAAAAGGSLSLGRLVTFASAAVATSMIAFGGLSWALDGAAAPAAAVVRLQATMAAAGALSAGRGAPPPEPAPRPEPSSPPEEADSSPRPAPPPSGGASPRPGPHVPLPQAAPPRPSCEAMPAHEIRFRNLTFGYPAAGGPVLAGFDLAIPAGSSLAIVGQNGAGKTTAAKLLCRLYDPQDGAIEVDGVDLRDLDLDGWRSRVAAVFQDFIRFELPLRDNVAPQAPGRDADAAIQEALAEAGAAGLASLDTVLARGYPGGTELSGGQWQRIALARALCAVRLGAGVVLLDEPTAQLDVRGEAEIFDRVLAATRHTTTILISHRFSTVRHADRICVLEHGKVVELGTHEELMAAGGRYRTMFELQASRFGARDGGGEGGDGGEPVELDVLD